MLASFAKVPEINCQQLLLARSPNCRSAPQKHLPFQQITDEIGDCVSLRHQEIQGIVVENMHKGFLRCQITHMEWDYVLLETFDVCVNKQTSTALELCSYAGRDAMGHDHQMESRICDSRQNDRQRLFAFTIQKDTGWVLT